MNKQQLASKIWEAANGMRSKIEASEYKDYILGFMFYKFLSEQEEKFYEKNGIPEDYIKNLSETDEVVVPQVKTQLGYFIEYKNLFSTWIKKGADFTVGDVRDALNAFNRLISPTHQKVFNKIFLTLETGLSKLGENSNAQTKAVRRLVQLISIIPMNNKQDYDVLGFIYEDLISKFAANAGKKAGEFYTPHEVSVLMSEIVADHLKDCESIKIYDSTSGSGSLLINIGQSVARYVKNKDNIKYYAQEYKENTYNLTRMNLVMRGILPDNIVTRCGDTLEDDWPYFDDNNRDETYEPLINLDAVVSNPPYSQTWDPTRWKDDPRFKPYGTAPKSKADYAFLLHDLYHLRVGGIMTIILPHGVLFRGGEEGGIRKKLIENNNIDAIIGLPANIFYGTGIPTIIMVLKKGRKNDDILIIDASKGFTKEGKNNKLRARDIKKIADTYIGRLDISDFSRKVSRDEIRKNEYNLNIPRYVDSGEKAESIDVYATMFGGVPKSEIEQLREYFDVFKGLKEEIFSDSTEFYADVKCDNIKNAIENNSGVAEFIDCFKSALSGFDNFLADMLIENMENINIARAEADIAAELFERLKNMPLTDKYEAYQILDDKWQGISGDLEIIQTEGKEAICQVDPNMVVKKKDGKEVEIQDGWIGHILPFELVQKELLREDLKKIEDLEAELSLIGPEYEELIEKIPEDEKGDFLNDDNTAFVPKEVEKQIKPLIKQKISPAVGSVDEILIKASKLMKKEKDLKKEITAEQIQLHNKTKDVIEGLKLEEALPLLRKKWIEPVFEEILSTSNSIITELENKVTSLVNKYSETMMGIESEIREAEEEFSMLIDELEGSEFDMQGLKELQKMLTEGHI